MPVAADGPHSDDQAGEGGPPADPIEDQVFDLTIDDETDVTPC